MGIILPQHTIASAGIFREEPGEFSEEGRVQLETAHGPATIVQSYKEIHQEVWRRTMEKEFMDWRYYEVVEETLRPGFDYRYVILTNSRTGEIAIQPFFFNDQDITAGISGPARSLVERVRRRFPRFLSMKIAMVGCSAGAGRLDCHEPWAIESLSEALEKYAKLAKASVILFKEFPAHYRPAFERLTRRGFTRAPSMPAAERVLDFESFEQFMEKHLSRVYRKSLRRKFRHAARLGEVTMEATHDVSPHIEEVHALYLQTYERSKLKFECLSKEYFLELSARMPDRIRYFLWRHNGKIVAFSVCMIHGNTLYDLNVGLDYSVALSLHMYFITWRDLVKWALEAKLERYYTGPLNYDPKLHLRLKLAPLDLYARHTSPLLNPLFGVALRYLQPVRYDPTVRRFPNSHEL
jgi:hypothetical protein